MHVFPHRVIAWVLLILAMVLAVVAASTSNWFKGNLTNEMGGMLKSIDGDLNINLSLGPFRSCVSTTSEVVLPGCVATGSSLKLSAKLQTVRAMTIISIISSALAVILCGVAHHRSNDGETFRGLHNAAVFFGWLAGVSGAVSVGVFASIQQVSSGLKWGYILMCISTVLAFVGAIMITAPAIPAMDIEPSAPTGETLVAAAISGATGVPVGKVTADHEAVKASMVAANRAKAAADPGSKEGRAAAADHESEVLAGVAEPSAKPLK